MLIGGVLLVPGQGALGGAIALALSSFAVWGLSHHYATRRVTPIPGLSAVLRPIVAAVVAAVSVRMAGLGPWWDAAAAAVIFADLALLLDRELIPDLRRLTRAKGRGH